MIPLVVPLSTRAVAGLTLAVTLMVLGGCSRARDTAAPGQPAPVASAATPPSTVGTATPGSSSRPPRNPSSGLVVPPHPSATPTAKAGSAKALIRPLTRAGIPCQGWQHFAQTSSARDLGACYLHQGDGGAQIVLATYATEKQAAAAAEQPGPVPGGAVVVGQKWTYSCGSVSLCRKIADKLGGRLVTFPG